MKNKEPKIGLALSGGGAKGIAHIGVIKALVDAGIKIDFISGTSMGAIVGGAFATGVSPDELITIAEKIKGRDILDFNFKRGSLLSGKSAEKIIRKIFKTDTFETTKIPFCCTAVNLKNGERVVLDRGDLIQSVRASMSAPVVFSPVEHNDMVLIDGGLAGNIPIKEVIDMGANIVIAVDVLGELCIDKSPKSLTGAVLDSVYILLHNAVKMQLKETKPNILININLGYDNEHKFSPKLAKTYIEKGKMETKLLIEKIKEEIEKNQN